MGEHKVSFNFVPPAFGKKNELCTMNNHSRWGRFAKTKIKQEFQDMISEWSLPPWEDNPFTKAEMECTILRKDGKKLDSDNLAFTYKWLQDILVLNNYLVDDDHVKVTLNPTRLNVKGEVETSVHVEIRLYERFTMTIEELKAAMAKLEKELENVGGENHVKAASLRARKILSEMKNAIPGLRKQLLDLDK